MNSGFPSFFRKCLFHFRHSVYLVVGDCSHKYLTLMFFVFVSSKVGTASATEVVNNDRHPYTTCSDGDDGLMYLFRGGASR